jgi:aspartate kinase
VSGRRLIMKFGGTSVADADAIRRLIDIVGRQRTLAGSPPVVVVSALAGVTDKLVDVARMAEAGQADAAAAELRTLSARHAAVAAAVTSAGRGALLGAIEREFEELIGIVHALAVLQEVSPRSLDAVLAAGEVVSSRIVAAACADHHLPGRWVDSRAVLVTDAEHNGAAPDMTATEQRVRAQLTPLVERGAIPVLGGFIGATAAGITTTLGRGGSDYSAAIFGACLGVDEIQIWTDVDGMLTADPRVVPQPQVVPQLSFAEASELAYFGAKVLHPSTILPAVARNIPVRILNSRRPDRGGTTITSAGAATPGRVTAIACKRDVTVIDITSTRMLMAHGFLRRLFEVFERMKTAVDVVTTSEVSVSVTVDDTRRLDAIVDNLRNFAEVSLEPEMAIVCIVGETLRADASLFGRAVTVLNSIPLRLVSQAAGRRNITFVIRNADVPEAMSRLHDALFRAETADRASTTLAAGVTE